MIDRKFMREVKREVKTRLTERKKKTKLRKQKKVGVIYIYICMEPLVYQRSKRVSVKVHLRISRCSTMNVGGVRRNKVRRERRMREIADERD